MAAPQFDVVIPIKADDWKKAARTIEGVRKFIRPRDIVIIASQALLQDVSFQASQCRFIDENELLEGLTLPRCRELMATHGMEASRVGWYFQQFLKLGYAFTCKDDYYLVWDADLIPLREITFFQEDGKPIFDLKPEYHAPYFDSIEKLLGYDKAIPESFIAEHMLMHAGMVREMLACMEKYADGSLKGKRWYEKVLHAASQTGSPSGFSEFETLGTFVMHRYPDAYALRKLKTFRFGGMIFPCNVEEKYLAWVAQELDTISFEAWDNSHTFWGMTKLLSVKFSFAQTFRVLLMLYTVLSKFGKKSASRKKNMLETAMGTDFLFSSRSRFENLGLSLKKNRKEQ